MNVRNMAEKAITAAATMPEPLSTSYMISYATPTGLIGCPGIWHGVIYKPPHLTRIEDCVDKG